MYTLEDYARDLEAISLPDLFGALNVAKTEVRNGLVNSQTRRSCREHIPLLLKEIERRGEKVPHWIYPYSLFNNEAKKGTR